MGQVALESFGVVVGSRIPPTAPVEREHPPQLVRTLREWGSIALWGTLVWFWLAHGPSLLIEFPYAVADTALERLAALDPLLAWLADSRLVRNALWYAVAGITFALAFMLPWQVLAQFDRWWTPWVYEHDEHSSPDNYARDSHA